MRNTGQMTGWRRSPAAGIRYSHAWPERGLINQPFSGASPLLRASARHVWAPSAS